MGRETDNENSPVFSNIALSSSATDRKNRPQSERSEERLLLLSGTVFLLLLLHPLPLLHLVLPAGKWRMELLTSCSAYPDLTA
jgi:hypothetical protein